MKLQLEVSEWAGQVGSSDTPESVEPECGPSRAAQADLCPENFRESAGPSTSALSKVLSGSLMKIMAVRGPVHEAWSCTSRPGSDPIFH